MKKWSILSILLLVIISLNGQSQLRAPNYKVVPVSPNAASLGSFGNIPVDRYVGKSSLSIPIFDLELDGKKFPISLFYHTDGTRVAQESSWVGLGWTLQCGGCIIRQMQGSDDFKQGGCYENTDAPWLEDPTFTINNQNASLYEAYFSGEYDTQPDLFYFNAGGYSGTLYFDALKNQRDNLAVPTILSEEQVVRMEYDILADIWTMTDVEGFVYSFSTPETTTPFLLRTTDLSRQPPSKEKFLYSQGEAVITAWMLDSIVSPLGGKIIFEYEQDQIYTPIQVNEDAVMLAHVYGGQMNNVSPSYTFRDVNYSYSYSVITQCRLSKIAYEGGTVEFLTSDREDIESKIAGRKVQKLSTIQVRNNNGQVVKTTNLKYRYLLSNAASTNKGTEDRLLLEMVYDSFGNTRNHLYSFQYNPGILPAKDSYSVDAWGFYNEATPLSHPNWLKLSPTIYEPETYAGIPDSRIFMLGMDRSFREDLCRIGTLRQVTYLTGGTTTFEYEAHRFDELPMMPPLRTQYLTSVDNSTECENPVANYCYLSSDIRISAQFPRVRVSFTHEEPHPSENIPFDITYSVYLEKKQGNEYVLSSTLCRDIKLKDPWPQAVETKLEEGTYRLRLVVTPYEFEYPITINANLHGVGMIIEEKDYLGAGLRLKAMTHTDGNGHSIRKYYEYNGARLMVKPCFNGTARVLQSGNYADNWLDAIYQLIQSAPYVPLTNLLRGNLVGYSTIDEITANVADNGLVRYMYLNIPDKMPEAYLAGVPSLPDHRSGKLIAVHHMDGFNHLLRSETYTYTPTPEQKTPAALVRHFYLSGNYDFPARTLQPYTLAAQSYYLSSKTVTEHRPRGDVVDTEWYEHTQYGMLGSVKSIRHGTEKEIRTIYAGGNSWPESVKLRERHMVGIPLEQIELIDGQVVNAWRTEYMDTLQRMLPKQTFRFDSKKLRTLSDYRSAYVPDIRFERYDARGRLLSYRQNGVTCTILWSYNHQYPVADIQGISYPVLESQVGNRLNGLAQLNDSAAISDLLENIRSQLPSRNLLMTSYLYKPLVGMCTTVYPNGQRTSYSYDGFSRLQQVRNHEGEVKETYSYHYQGQTPNAASEPDLCRNYIRHRRMLNRNGLDYMDETIYVDRLGRPFQEVHTRLAGTAGNLISVQEYDDAGRKSKQWQPVHSLQAYLPLEALADTAAACYENDTHPYSYPVYEKAALNRKVEEYGPGMAWQGGHSVKSAYLTNSVTDSVLLCKRYTVGTAGQLENKGPYPAAELLVTRTIGEADDTTFTFQDKNHRTVLIRQLVGTDRMDTYSVYDVRGNLALVLQPMFQVQPDLDAYSFQYKYDGRNHCVWMKKPGAAPTVYEYDMYDRLIFSQDGNQRLRKHQNWIYYKYDPLNRLQEQGICTDRQITSDHIPSIINYYDDYRFAGKPEFSGNYHVSSQDNSGKGRLTGQQLRIIDQEGYLCRSIGYDQQGREVKRTESNSLGGYDVFQTSYSFTDQPLSVHHLHTSRNGNLAELHTFTYDQADRISRVTHRLNQASPVLLAEYEYDGLGRLNRKTRGKSAGASTYTYNIRGWLTGISGVGFTQHLCYTDGPGIPCYNGNISSMRWQAGKESTIRGYRFLYDKDNRLMTAAYGEGSSLSSNMGRFAEQVTGYDMNGNILGLMRYGAISSNRFGMLDHLTYTLKGNQLQRVDDAVATLPEKESFEFADRVKQPEEYMYDANGNLTKDLNKDISQIQYNFLNLPRKAVFGDGDSIIYVYAADGSKLRRVTAKGRNTGTRDYCSNLIYENDVPTWLLTESGYITLSDGKYHYYLQDHQGNNRVVVNEFGKVEEVNHYYPFGGIFAYTASVQPYKYNGKELEKSLWEYDYGARRYDAVLARWLTLDPSAEKYLMYSPYLYCKNNPILRIDLDGKDDYIVDSKGILFCKRVNQSAVDYVYYNKIGNDKRIFITDKNLLPSMKKNQTIAKNGYSAFGSTNNLGDAVRLFKFCADHTAVEWKLDAYANESEHKYVIITDHKQESIEDGSFAADQLSIIGKKVVDIHSHPSKDTQGASDNDLKYISAPYNAVYFKKDATLHEYDLKNKNLNRKKIDSEKVLENYILSKMLK